MNLTVDQNNNIVLREVFNPIVLITDDDDIMIICMRDSGFEFTYQGKSYSAKQGIIEKL